MKLKTPVTGTVVDVPDKEAGLYTAQGFRPADEKPKPAARKRAAKKKE